MLRKSEAFQGFKEYKLHVPLLEKIHYSDVIRKLGSDAHIPTTYMRPKVRLALTKGDSLQEKCYSFIYKTF